jgi:hypothetical protein
MILKSLQGTTTAHTWEETQLAWTNNFKGLVANLELAAAATVVATSAQAEVRAATADKVADATVALAIENTTVTEITAARDYEKRACGRPGLLEKDGLCDGDDGVVG